MAMTPLDMGEAVPITGYGPGFWRVGDEVRRGHQIVTPGGAQPWGGLDDIAALEALAGSVDILLLGMGADVAHPPAALRERLARAGLSLDAMASPTAARSYNMLASEGRRVAAALIALPDTL